MGGEMLNYRSQKPPVDWAAYAFVAVFTAPFLVFNIAPILFAARR